MVGDLMNRVLTKRLSMACASMLRRLEQLAVLLAGLCIGISSFAQDTLPDPMRPPAGLLAAANTASSATPSEGLVLQSVMLNHRQGRNASAAVISGQIVQLGGAVGDMKLAAINEHSVQLKGAQGTTTLRLTPDAQKNNPTISKTAKSAEPTR